MVSKEQRSVVDRPMLSAGSINRKVRNARDIGVYMSAREVIMYSLEST
jgi:hypothetical protein